MNKVVNKNSKSIRQSVWYKKLMSDYGMIFILILLCGLFSILTISEQHPVGAQAADNVISQLSDNTPENSKIAIIASTSVEEQEFVTGFQNNKLNSNFEFIYLTGNPSEIKSELMKLDSADININQIVTTYAFAPTATMLVSQFDRFKNIKVITPSSKKWPIFLTGANIRNVANQISVIAIIAIGMTMVIITAGIDLSVGSIIALSAVVVAWIVGQFGGTGASTSTIILAGLGGLVVSGGVGAFSGLMITGFRIPPFIATLAMMQVAAGVGYIISQGKPIYQLPDSFVWLGRGVEPLFHIPIAVILMLALYIIAHLIMSRTTFGRYIYAVGGNIEAARLSGIRVNRILFSVYTICGILAGLGGIVMASQLKSGAPTYGLTYELYVIAAVVVGGTSLMGGEGRILGTLIGAFIIAVIQNGMNLVNVESYTQKVVLGLVILAAVLIDRLKQRKFNWHKLLRVKKHA